MLNAIVALRYLGYSFDDPQMIRAMDEFEKLGIDCPKGPPDYPTPTFRMQSLLFARVGHRAGAVDAGRGGRPKHGSAAGEGCGLAAVEGVRHKGDWAENVKIVTLADGTSSSTMIFSRMWMIRRGAAGAEGVDNPRERYQHEVTQRAMDWIFAMQCKNGGWASFDKDNTKKIFESIPFADHNAMIDPPTVDITGRILEMLANYGYTRRDKRVEKAVQFILREQEPDGAGLAAGA